MRPASVLDAELEGCGARSRRPSWSIIAAEAPVVRPDAFLALGLPGIPLLWDAGSEGAIAGRGLHTSIQGHGPARFRELERGLGALRRTFAGSSGGPFAFGGPRLFGGLAFSPSARPRPAPWEGLFDGNFHLPRIGYEHDGRRGVVYMACTGEGPPEGVTFLERLAEDLDRAARVPREEAAPDAVGTRALDRPEASIEHGPDRVRFERGVVAARAAIEAGVLEKVVLARRDTVSVPHGMRAEDLVKSLTAEGPSTTRYLVSGEGWAYVGASPERLMTLSGCRLVTEALAGTLSMREGTADQLLASRKDLHEHGFVIDFLRGVLSALGADVSVGPTAAKSLRTLHHLWTPFTATLPAPVSALRVLELLHPTPAVCGVPRENALAFLEGHEATDRGLYGAPVGWLGLDGSASFVVALRGVLLDASRGWLYAGAGIVAASDPVREWLETEAKLQGTRQHLARLTEGGR